MVEKRKRLIAGNDGQVDARGRKVASEPVDTAEAADPQFTGKLGNTRQPPGERRDHGQLLAERCCRHPRQPGRLGSAAEDQQADG